MNQINRFTFLKSSNLFSTYKFLLFEIFIASLISSCLFAQKENNIWLLPGGCGLDFNVEPPQKVEGNQIPEEGLFISPNSTVCNGAGELLFYTDGSNVWDRNNQIMPNGKNLEGSLFWPQGVVVVPFIDDPNKYFVFTVEIEMPAFRGDMYYSIIDMTANGGYGDVVNRGELLATNQSINIVAVPGPCHSVWVITHEINSNRFNAFEVSDMGVALNPIVSEVGQVHLGRGPNRLKASPDGKRLIFTNSKLEIFEFNKNTGKISNAIELGQGEITGSGCFSPNSKLLYCAIGLDTEWGIYQYDLSSNIESVIQSSGVLIGTYFLQAIHDFQIGPDSLIYIDLGAFKVIPNPNQLGVACGYEDLKIDLSNCGRYGFDLPTPVVKAPNIENPPIEIPDTSICSSIEIQYDIRFPESEYLWQDGETSGIREISNFGKYWVQRSISDCIVSDTFTVSIIDAQLLNLGPDLSICDGDSVEVKIQMQWDSVFWNDDNRDYSRIFKSPGNYTVFGWKEGCISQDDLRILESSNCDLSNNIFIPNVFSPNSDGTNDIFKIYVENQLSDFSMQIFNRWGGLIFSSFDPKLGWTGNYANGEEVPSGVYVYKVSYILNQNIYAGYGTITLLR